MSAGSWRLPPAAADTGSTFLSHALAPAALHGSGPWPDGGYPLPDQETEDSHPLLVGAVGDGIRTHHFGFRPDDPAATRIAQLLDSIVGASPTAADLGSLHDIRAEQPTLETLTTHR